MLALAANGMPMYQVDQPVRIDRCPECFHAHQAPLERSSQGWLGDLAGLICRSVYSVTRETGALLPHQYGDLPAVVDAVKSDVERPIA